MLHISSRDLLRLRMSFCSSIIELHFQLCYRLLCVTLIQVPLCVSVLHPQTGLQLPDCWATLGMWPKAKSLSKASKGHPAWACCDTDSKGGTGAYGLKTYVPENRARSFFFLETYTAIQEKGWWFLSFQQWCGHEQALFPLSHLLSAQHQHIKALQELSWMSLAWCTASASFSLLRHLSQLLLWEAPCSP